MVGGKATGRCMEVDKTKCIAVAINRYEGVVVCRGSIEPFSRDLLRICPVK